MEPNSVTLLVLLLLAAGGLIYVIVRYRQLIVRIVAGVLTVALAMTAGMAVVNDYYGYYQTWSQLAADLSGNYASFTAAPGHRADPATGAGRLESVVLPGHRSGITRNGLIYLPPQYFQAKYRHVRFPVLELIHGTPGSPSSWIVHLDLVRLVNEMIQRHLLGPMVLVMPTMSVGRRFEECVNAPGALDDTYITHDVRTDIEARFRVSRTAAEWGIAGYSSGGYCAANLAMRHRAAFGAAGVMDGYYRPQDGPAAAALGGSPTAEAANDPISLAGALPLGASPLPAFWLSAGTGNAADIAGARAFAAALRGIERVPLFLEPNAGHNFYAWAPALPHLLPWMWAQLAPPALRVKFPIAGGVQQEILPAPGAAPGAYHHRRHRPATRPSHLTGAGGGMWNETARPDHGRRRS
jgi:enterochelin esterase-like enzyme